MDLDDPCFCNFLYKESLYCEIDRERYIDIEHIERVRIQCSCRVNL